MLCFSLLTPEIQYSTVNQPQAFLIDFFKFYSN